MLIHSSIVILLGAMFRMLLLFFVLVSVQGSPRNDIVNSVYLTAQTIMSHGYIAETHHVVTTDGYILEMHRIPYSRYQTNSLKKRPPVFLMHGLMSASNAYIALGPEYSISYNLADAGFDVWMGNARGSKPSRFHETLDPDNIWQRNEFFDYSYEDIGLYDISAMVDYILNLTDREKIHYIGHSQGGTVFLVLNSMRPEYNEKFATVNLLAGVGYQEYFPDEELISTANMVDFIYGMALLTGNIESYPPSDDGMRTVSKTMCSGDEIFEQMCETTGLNKFFREDIIGTAEPGGGSLKQVAHYGQNIRDKLFRRWAHTRSSQNQEAYGQNTPPLYDLSLITANVTMHYTISDNLLDERDVIAMADDMPNCVVRKVARDSFLHSDFAVAPDVKELVTDFMIEEMIEVERQIYGWDDEITNEITTEADQSGVDENGTGGNENEDRTDENESEENETGVNTTQEPVTDGNITGEDGEYVTEEIEPLSAEDVLSGNFPDSASGISISLALKMSFIGTFLLVLN